MLNSIICVKKDYTRILELFFLIFFKILRISYFYKIITFREKKDSINYVPYFQ